tara:strand:- start:163 stop:1242 length:1080 start_codon:yes stop_codon:yes gene_type:complete
MSKARELAELGAAYDSGALSNRNVIINGAMQVAQRGTSSTGLGATSGYYTVDRYNLVVGNTAGRLTMSQDSSAPSGFANSLKLDCTTADTSIAADEFLIMRHTIEAQDCQQFAKGTSDAKQFALSFYVKGNASATYVAELVGDDVSRQISQTFSVTTDWTRVKIIFPADTTGAINDDNGAGLYLNIWLHAGSDFTGGSLSTTWSSITQANRAVGISSFFDSTDRTFFLTGVQLEVGSEATPFEHRLVADELERCKRYFQCSATSMNGGDRDDSTQTDEMYFGRGESYLSLFFNPAMRAAPTVTTSSDTGTGAGRYTIAGVNNYTDGTAVKITQNFYSMLTPSTNASYNTKTGFDADAEL